MLEHRPLLQRTVYASGAFALVFFAAMAGTGVMMTGGPFPALAHESAIGETFPGLPSSSENGEVAPAWNAAVYAPAHIETGGGADPYPQRVAYAEPNETADAPQQGEEAVLAPIQLEDRQRPEADQGGDAKDNEAAWAKLGQDLAALNAEDDEDDMFTDETPQR
ncbi:MAG TPA: hypothetical protein VG841_00585 [Caulobacterales bacterium]|nr:hypothetical protein [Caulobacterales bacterium]